MKKFSMLVVFMMLFALVVPAAMAEEGETTRYIWVDSIAEEGEELIVTLYGELPETGNYVILMEYNDEVLTYDGVMDSHRHGLFVDDPGEVEGVDVDEGATGQYLIWIEDTEVNRNVSDKLADVYFMIDGEGNDGIGIDNADFLINYFDADNDLVNDEYAKAFNSRSAMEDYFADDDPVDDPDDPVTIEDAEAAVDALFDEEGNLLDSVTQVQIDEAYALVADFEDHDLYAGLVLRLQDAQEQFDARCDDCGELECECVCDECGELLGDCECDPKKDDKHAPTGSEMLPFLLIGGLLAVVGAVLVLPIRKLRRQ